MRASIVGLAFSTAARDADYVPTGHRALAETASLPVEAALEVLRPIFEDEAVKKAGHDLKFDAIVLAQHGVTLRGFDTDTMLASYLIDATRSEHKLEDLALEHTSYKALTEEDVCGRGTKAVSLADLPVEAAVDFACERADLVGQLVPIFNEQLAKDELTDVYDTLERPLIESLPFSMSDRQGGMFGLLHALESIATLLLMCDARDLGTAIGERPPSPGSEIEWEESPDLENITALAEKEFFEPNLYLYDAYPGGIGFSEPLYRTHQLLLTKTRELIERKSHDECANGSATARMTSSPPMRIKASAHL